MNDRLLRTARGAGVAVLEMGPETGPPLLFLHGIAGRLDEHTFLERLAASYRVYAPELPGYGESSGEELFEDMLDFALHGWDVLDRLGLAERRPVLVGHSLGGMIAAEMACLAPRALSRLVLVDPLGLWLDEHPVPDLFSWLPFEFADFLFHDQERGVALLTGGAGFEELTAMGDFMVANARRLGTAGKMLFPVPDRRLSKRLYRLTTETLLVWGEDDQLVPPVYAGPWAELLPRATVARVAGAGHMLPYEQPQELADRVSAFLA